MPRLAPLNTFAAVLSVAAWLISASAYAGAPTATDSQTSWVPAAAPQTSYRIAVSIDPASGTLTGTESIRFRNRSSRAIGRVAMMWPGAGGSAESEFKVTASGKRVAVLTKGNPTVLELPAPVKPGKGLQLDVAFTIRANPNDEAIRNSKVIPITDWYPRLWWGGDSHASYRVKLDAPKDYSVVATGLLDRRSGMYRADKVGSFGVVLVKGMQIHEKRAGDVLVRCVGDFDRPTSQSLLMDSAVDVINFYRHRFGFYPYPVLNIIPGQEQSLGGYPVAPCIVAIHGQSHMRDKPENWWRWITAHEIGHQYFHEYVLGEMPGWNGIDWLSIGLGVVADREYSVGHGLGTEHQRQMMRLYLDAVRDGINTTVERPIDQYKSIGFDFNNVVIHGKGFSIVSSLNCVLGKRTFDRIVARCLKEYGGRRLSAASFQEICEEESGQELGWFFEQWVHSNRALAYQIAGKKEEHFGGGYRYQIQVERTGDLEMPIPVSAKFADGTGQVKFTDRLLKMNELVFESASPLTTATLDPAGELPLSERLPDLDSIRQIGDLPWTASGDKALEIYGKMQPNAALTENQWGKLGLTLYDGEHYEQALRAFEKCSEAANKDSEWGFASLVWQGHLLDLLGRRAEAVARYQESLKQNTSRTMQHGQYDMRIDRQWVQERLATPFQRAK